MKGKKLIKAAIIGATGYSGAQLASILTSHKDVEITALTSKSYAGQRYSDVYKNFKGILDLPLLSQNMEDIKKIAEVIFVALPHGIASSQITSDILKDTKVIDLGADFRLKSKDLYESWYKTLHHAPNLLCEAVYGLPEWNKENIAKASLIANPGCYATCSILTVAPLLKEGIIEPKDIIIDAKSGVSGAGRTLDIGTHYCECSESIKAYKIASHRHTPEIEQVLDDISGSKALINFTPHLIPMNRGILVSAYLKPKKDISLNEVKNIYKKYYQNEPFVRLLNDNQSPETKWVKGSNYCDINVFEDERTRRIIALGAIDNLIKGASGQAVQNMNLMFDLDETTALKSAPVFP